MFVQAEEEQTESVLTTFTTRICFPNIDKTISSCANHSNIAQCERSFFSLTSIKTHLRTTMTDQRLSSTTFLEDIISEFEGIDNNRTIILS